MTLVGEAHGAARDVCRSGCDSEVFVAGEIDISTAPRLWACLNVALERRRPVVLAITGLVDLIHIETSTE